VGENINGEENLENVDRDGRLLLKPILETKKNGGL